jgi:hypothetical protein
MTLRDTIPLQENAPGCQLYLPEKIATDPAFGLTPGTEIEAVVIPHRGVVLLPTAPELDWPLTIEHPSRIDDRLTTD